MSTTPEPWSLAPYASPLWYTGRMILRGGELIGHIHVGADDPDAQAAVLRLLDHGQELVEAARELLSVICLDGEIRAERIRAALARIDGRPA